MESFDVGRWEGFNRALNAAEVRAIADAGSAGRVRAYTHTETAIRTLPPGRATRLATPGQATIFDYR